MNDDIAAVPEIPPKKRGRTPSRVWKIISSRDDEMDCTVCNCCFCKGVVSHYGHVDRVVQHLLICLHCPLDVKESLLLQYPNLDPNKPKETMKEENNQPPWTSHQQQEFEVLLSDFIYANNLPFNIVNYDLMKQLIYKLNPQAKLPSSDKLATLLLDESYQRVKDAMMAKINASTSYYTLQNDATEDISEHSIFNFVISNPYESFYLKTLDATADVHSGEFIAQEVTKAITEDFPIEKKISTVISDNTKANKKSWKLIKEKKPKLAAYGCNSHNSHLLVKDLTYFKPGTRPPHEIVKKLSETLGICKEVTKHFKSHRIISSALQKEQDLHKFPHLALPGETRWGSHHRCVNNVKISYQLIKMVMNDDDSYFYNADADQVVARKELRKTFSEKKVDIDHCAELLSVLTHSIERFESNKSPLSDVITNFTKLEKKIEEMRRFDEAEKTFIKLQIKKRRDFIASEDHKIALLLDPRYKFTDYYSATEEISVSNK